MNRVERNVYRTHLRTAGASSRTAAVLRHSTSADEAREMEVDRHGKAYRAVIKRMGSTANSAWAGPRNTADWGSGRSNSRSSSTRRPARTCRCCSTLQTVGPTPMAYGNEAQKKKFLPAILAGEVHFRDRLLRARSRHGPRRCAPRPSASATNTSSTARRSGPPAAADADYVWLAYERPDAAKHSGDDPHRLIRPTWLPDADHPVRWCAPHERHLLQRRPGSGRHARRRGERRLATDHHPAQSRAGHARASWEDRRTL